MTIRFSKLRLLPAIKNRKQENPTLEYVMKWLRIFSPLIEIPVFPLKGKLFFLDSNPQPNSKGFAVIDEFSKAGFPLQSIFTKETEPSNFKKLIRFSFYFFVVLPVLFRMLKKLNGVLDKIDFQILLGYVAYIHFVKKNKCLIPIIISDITPTSHMLWSATVSLNRQVFWWQDDYHHYKGFSKENYLPYMATYAAVLNQKGLETILDKNPESKIFLRNQIKVKPIKPIPPNPKVGIATNAFFEARPDQIELLEKIKNNLDVDFLKIRLHPNSKLKAESFPESLVEIAAFDESISDFVETVDLAVVGNSAVQLKLLCEGLPVVHIGGLDKYDFDSYGYCQNGFCYGTNDIIGLDLNLVKKFYSNPSIREKLNDYVNVKSKEQCQPLSLLTQIHKN